MMKIEIELNENSIRKAISQLETYRDDLSKKSQLLCSELADVGIEVAKVSTRNYGGFIVFSKLITFGTSDKAVTIFYAKKTTDLIRQWFYKGGIKTVEIDPLLMEEFGSGFKAVNTMKIPGVGQGTFPEQKHAFDESGWSWTTLDGVTHHSYGEAPGQPMYNAREQMIHQVNDIGRRIFSNVV